MDFTRRIKQEIRKPTTGSKVELYPHDVQFYILPPTYDITIPLFEELAFERLKVLRILEQANNKNLRLFSQEWKESVITDLNKEGLKNYVKLCQGTGSGTTEAHLQARKRDHISHFILRLAYCRSKDLQGWFLAREMELFKMRFATLSNDSMKQFLKVNNLSYEPISVEEKDRVKDGLYESTLGSSVAQIEMQDFYKVPFQEVLDLVRSRRVYLQSGFAYVPTTEFVSVVSSKHSSIISTGLEATSRILPDIECDERLVGLLKGLHTSYTGKDYTLSKTACVPLESIDQLSKKSFPLCMRMCHETLREKHHMKHFGRLQYGLFLKAIGVTLEDAIKFWHDEFVKIMDEDKFTKNYLYNIRYNYGKEGSMINYTPYSCMKIITTSVGPGDTHGCPFKTYDASNLKQKMMSCGIPIHQLQEVANYAAKGHYQIACSRYFEISHGVNYDGGINHPNQYFEESQYVIGNKQRPNKSRQSSAMKNEAGFAAQLLSQDDWDEELWNIGNEAENKENTYNKNVKNDNKKDTNTNAKEAWDDEFDVSMMDEDF